MFALDFAVALALVLSIGSTLLCVGYGFARWNADDDQGDDPPTEERGDR